MDDEDPGAEFKKPKEVLEEEKKVALAIRVKPLDVDKIPLDKLKAKAQELWERIVKLESENYDLQETEKRQEYDVSFASLRFTAYF
jgi:hypothetical protein